MAEVVSLPEAIAKLVRDGNSLAMEGFTHLIPFAAGPRCSARLRPRPGGVIIPSCVIDAVAEAPGGPQPSSSLGITERDNGFYRGWDAISRDRERFRAWMDEHVLCGAPV
jgi:hypothetical protein